MAEGGEGPSRAEGAGPGAGDDWTAVLCDDDLATMRKELAAADGTERDEIERAWRETAHALSDPDRAAILLAPFGAIGSERTGGGEGHHPGMDDLRVSIRARTERINAARRELLRTVGPEAGRYTDLEAAAGCRCGCHPQPGDDGIHGGERCDCQMTDAERAERTRGALEQLALITEAEAPRLEAEQEAIAAAAATYGATVHHAGGWAPYQIEGEIDGTPFYLRSRHGSWRLQISEAGEKPHSFEAPTIAAGEDEDLFVDGDAAAPLRRAVTEVRQHLARQRCTHRDGGVWCPDCGTLLDPGHHLRR